MRQAQARLAGWLVLLAGAAPAFAQTAFTYQGKLDESSAAADGNYDFIFRLFDALNSGAQVGPAVTINDWAVTDGLFTVQLDFGVGAFAGAPRWLQVEVRPGASMLPHTVLGPRQPLTAAPYAIYAFNGPGGGGGFWALNGSHIYKTNGGNVGINTNTPATALEVRHSLRVANIQSGPFVLQSPAIFDLKSNAVGTTYPYGSIRFYDGADALRGSIEVGQGPNQFGPDEGMRFATEGAIRMTISPAGNVGVGTTDPDFLLDAAGRIQLRQNTGSQGNSNTAGLWLYQNGPAELRGFIGMRDDNQIGFYGTEGASWGLLMNVANNNVGINRENPSARLHVECSDDQLAQFTQFGNQPGMQVTSIHGTTNYPALSVAGFSSNAPALSVTGRARVDVLEITGADVAEKFPVSEDATFEPGTVMSIDPANPGKLCLARGAYNRCVAGVVSGAGGLPVGAVLGNLPGQADAPAIALSGRVWVRCDARSRAIQPGDLLTTSDTPGCAMAVTDHGRALGAVIGKAMTGLGEGETGLVLVLVNLQ